MLTFRALTPADHDVVLPMVRDFYRSDAVLHPIDGALLERSFRAAVDPDQPLLRGVMILSDGTPAGYLYITRSWSTDAGGPCVFLEEIYFAPAFRGRGLGGQALDWLRGQYPEACRFRLELTHANGRAAQAYRRAGYQPLDYDQMVIDLPENSASPEGTV